MIQIQLTRDVEKSIKNVDTINDIINDITKVLFDVPSEYRSELEDAISCLERASENIEGVVKNDIYDILLAEREKIFQNTK